MAGNWKRENNKVSIYIYIYLTLNTCVASSREAVSKGMWNIIHGFVKERMTWQVPLIEYACILWESPSARGVHSLVNLLAIHVIELVVEMNRSVLQFPPRTSSKDIELFGTPSQDSGEQRKAVWLHTLDHVDLLIPTDFFQFPVSGPWIKRDLRNKLWVLSYDTK